MNIRKNFLVNVLDSSFHGLSFAFVSPITILPVYVSFLTHNLLAIGLVSAITNGAYLLPQLFVANRIVRLKYIKPVVVNIGFVLERLPFLGMSISAIILAYSHPEIALVVFFVLLIWQGLGEGVVSIAWQTMLAKLFPVTLRGRFFGIAGFGEGLLGIIGSFVALYIFSHYAFPNNFAILFGFAFAGLLLAWLFLRLTVEPISESSVVPPISVYQYIFHELPRIIQVNTGFRIYIISRIFYSFGRMGLGFIAIYAIKKYNLADNAIGLFTNILLISQMFASLIFGQIADLVGHKFNIIAGNLCIIASSVMVLIKGDVALTYAIFALVGISLAVEATSVRLIVFEFAGENDRASFIGMAGTIIGIFNLIAPFIGGYIASLWGLQVLFIAAAMVATCALLWSFFVREPRGSKV